MKKWASTLLAVMCAGVFATGCGGGGQTEGSDNANNSKAEKVTVTLWGLDSHYWVDPAIEAFEQANPQIHVEYTKYAVDPMKEALKIAANSRTLPDMWFTWGGSLGGFYPENGLTMDLTQAAADHKWSEKYNQAAIEMATYDGKVSGVPLSLNVLGLWYPKSAADKFGLAPAASLAEFESQLQTLKDGGLTPFSMAGKGGWHIMRLTEQLLEHYAGPELHDKLNRMEASWNDPAVVRTFAKLKEYADKGYFAKGHISLDPNEAAATFYQEQAGFTIEGTWFDRNIVQNGFSPESFAVTAFPNGHNPPRPSVFTEMYQINGDIEAAKQEAALQFAEFMTGSDFVSQHIEQYASPAALGVKYADSTPHIKPLVDSAASGSFLITDQALPQIVVQKLFESQDRVTLGEWTPEQAAEAMQKAVEEYKQQHQ